MGYLNQKVIWITGASSGIGEALVYELSSRPVKLIISARRKEKLEAVKAKCNGRAEIEVLPLDLAKADELPGKADEALSMYSGVDVLVLNGGISQRDFAMNTSLDVSRYIMEVNYFSSLILTKAVVPSMIERGEGQIVPVSSLVGKFGTPFRSSYSASKHALHGYFDSLRAELYDQNISVTIVCPGFIKTELSLNAVLGSGEKNNTLDEAQAKGMPASIFARKMIRVIEKKKLEAYIGGRETFGVLLKRFLPNLFAKIILKARVR